MGKGKEEGSEDKGRAPPKTPTVRGPGVASTHAHTHAHTHKRAHTTRVNANSSAHIYTRASSFLPSFLFSVWVWAERALLPRRRL